MEKEKKMYYADSMQFDGIASYKNHSELGSLNGSLTSQILHSGAMILMDSVTEIVSISILIEQSRRS
jgi:hypothetical protein